MDNWVPCSMPDFAWQIVKNAELASPLCFPTQSIPELQASMSDQGFYSRILITGTGRPLHCKQNVDQYINLHGGEAVRGVIIWQDPTTRALKTEVHFVVRTLGGEVVDVTSTFAGDPLIFFVSKT